MYAKNQVSRSQKLGKHHLTTALALSAIALVLIMLYAAGERRASGASQPPPQTAGVVLRVGTYDSRAIAVAYTRSSMSAQSLKQLQQQHADAKKAGNQKLTKQLEAQGESLQIRRHLQGFSTAPVDDILEQVRDKLPSVAKARNVAVITCTADYHDASVELVDVTDELVALFNPDEQTQKIIADLRKRKPEPIEAIAQLPAKK